VVEPLPIHPFLEVVELCVQPEQPLAQLPDLLGVLFRIADRQRGRGRRVLAPLLEDELDVVFRRLGVVLDGRSVLVDAHDLEDFDVVRRFGLRRIRPDTFGGHAGHLRHPGG
jgi:hypothetical protein